MASADRVKSLTVAIVLCAFFAPLTLAASGNVTFQNTSHHYLYVAVTDNCTGGYNSASVLNLPPSQSATYLAAGAICFAYSAYPQPLQALWGAGRATPGQTVTIPTNSRLLQVNTQDQALQPEQPDSAVLAATASPDRVKQFAVALPGLSQATRSVTAAAPSTFERSLVSWLDHTSRQSKTDCVQEAIVDIPFDGQARFCTGWRTQWRCPRNEAVLVVQTLDLSRADQAIGSCLRTAAVVGAIAAIASGGSAGVPAAEAAFSACLVDAVISAHIEIRGGWTDWGGC